MKNPIEKRLQTERLKRLAETFVGKKNFSWWALFYASLIFIVTGWLPDGIAELLRREWVGGSYKTIASLAILLFIGFRFKEAFKYKGKIEVRSEHPARVKALVIFLSKLSMKKEVQDKELAEIKQALDNNSFTEDFLVKKTWEMPVLAIKYHLPELKYLYTLTSSGPDGSSQLMPIFTQVVNRLFPSVEVIELTPRGIQFEDIKTVFEEIEKFYSKVKEEGIIEKDTIVDITGGQKTNSIAASIATLAIGRQFQYVSTIDKRVLSYDVGYFEEE
jgi:hypothetical protein